MEKIHHCVSRYSQIFSLSSPWKSGKLWGNRLICIKSLTVSNFAHSYWWDILATKHVQWDNCAQKWHQVFWIVIYRFRIEKAENRIKSDRNLKTERWKSYETMSKWLLSHLYWMVRMAPEKFSSKFQAERSWILCPWNVQFQSRWIIYWGSFDQSRDHLFSRPRSTPNWPHTRRMAERCLTIKARNWIEYGGLWCSRRLRGDKCKVEIGDIFTNRIKKVSDHFDDIVLKSNLEYVVRLEVPLQRRSWGILISRKCRWLSWGENNRILNWI
jgi:hypothetical protein